MKKFRILLLLLIPFLFSSCVDCIQSISYKNGKYHFFYKVIFSKTLMEMSDIDSDEIMKGVKEEQLSSLPEGIEIKKIENESEIGFSMAMDIDPKTENEDEKMVLPKVSENKVYVPFLIGESSYNEDFSEDEDLEEAKEVLAYAKSRIVIGKSVVKTIKSAYFEGEVDNYVLNVDDLGDAFSLDVPFSLIIENDNYNVRRIVIEK